MLYLFVMYSQFDIYFISKIIIKFLWCPYYCGLNVLNWFRQVVFLSFIAICCILKKKGYLQSAVIFLLSSCEHVSNWIYSCTYTSTYHLWYCLKVHVASSWDFSKTPFEGQWLGISVSIKKKKNTIKYINTCLGICLWIDLVYIVHHAVEFFSNKGCFNVTYTVFIKKSEWLYML